MALTNIKGERGSLDSVFAGGRVYVLPSDGMVGPPEGWEQPPAPPAETPPPPTEQPTRVAPPQQADNLESELLQQLQPTITKLVADSLPKEFINLDASIASFRGYVIPISPEAIVVIEEILATEVEFKLREEVERVRRSVRDKGLHTNPNAGLADLPPVPSPESPVDQTPPSSKVQRMWKPRAPRRKADVPVVPSPQDDQTPSAPNA